MNDVRFKKLTTYWKKCNEETHECKSQSWKILSVNNLSYKSKAKVSSSSVKKGFRRYGCGQTD